MKDSEAIVATANVNCYCWFLPCLLREVPPALKSVLLKVLYIYRHRSTNPCTPLSTLSKYKSTRPVLLFIQILREFDADTSSIEFRVFTFCEIQSNTQQYNSKQRGNGSIQKHFSQWSCDAVVSNVLCALSSVISGKQKGSQNIVVHVIQFICLGLVDVKL